MEYIDTLYADCRATNGRRNLLYPHGIGKEPREGPKFPLRGDARFCDASSLSFLTLSTLYGEDSIIGKSVLLEEAGGRVKHDQHDRLGCATIIEVPCLF